MTKDDEDANLRKALNTALKGPLTKEQANEIINAGRDMLKLAEDKGAYLAYITVVNKLHEAREFSAALIVMNDLIERVLPLHGTEAPTNLLEWRDDIIERRPVIQRQWH
jgi:hypothetical protein